jgi:hypothetical protein
MFPGELEKAIVYSDKARDFVIEKAGLSREDFRMLLITNVMNDKLGKVTKAQVSGFIGIGNLKRVHKSMNRLFKAGYLSIAVKQRFYMKAGKMMSEPAYFTVTNKTTYLIRKYTDRLRELMEDERF